VLAALALAAPAQAQLRLGHTKLERDRGIPVHAAVPSGAEANPPYAASAGLVRAFTRPRRHELTRAGSALETPARLVLWAPGASCPTGVPVQTITVVNRANVRPRALEKVELAVTDQSMQFAQRGERPASSSAREDGRSP
jgi:hypothetical protein